MRGSDRPPPLLTGASTSSSASGGTAPERVRGSCALGTGSSCLNPRFLRREVSCSVGCAGSRSLRRSRNLRTESSAEPNDSGSDKGVSSLSDCAGRDWRSGDGGIPS